MSEQRAILVSRGPFGWEFADGSKSYVAAAEAAGDQPRIRWCAEHGHEALCECGDCDFGCSCSRGESTCRVVDAIVCCLEES